MNSKTKSSSFLEIYQTEIAPQLQCLDIILKSMDEPLNVIEASEALYITETEIKEIMRHLNISVIDRKAFLKIMNVASSPICRLYQRERDIGSPHVYTQEEISYIYAIPIDTINQVCDDLGLVELTAYTLPELFSNVNMQPVGKLGTSRY